jgi:hypothetical protein
MTQIAIEHLVSFEEYLLFTTLHAIPSKTLAIFILTDILYTSFSLAFRTFILKEIRYGHFFF